jgi:hypothetical protein
MRPRSHMTSNVCFEPSGRNLGMRHYEPIQTFQSRCRSPDIRPQCGRSQGHLPYPDSLYPMGYVDIYNFQIDTKTRCHKKN